MLALVISGANAATFFARGATIWAVGWLVMGYDAIIQEPLFMGFHCIMVILVNSLADVTPLELAVCSYPWHCSLSRGICISLTLIGLNLLWF